MNRLRIEFTVSSYCEIELPILSLPGAASSLGWGSWNSSCLWSTCPCVCRQQAVLHPASPSASSLFLSLVQPPSSPKDQLESASASPLDCSQIHLIFSVSSVLLVRSQFFMPAIVTVFFFCQNYKAAIVIVVKKKTCSLRYPSVFSHNLFYFRFKNFFWISSQCWRYKENKFTLLLEELDSQARSFQYRFWYLFSYFFSSVKMLFLNSYLSMCRPCSITHFFRNGFPH